MHSASRNIKKFLFRLYLSLPGSKYVFLGLRKLTIPSYKFRRLLRFRGPFQLSLDKGVSITLMNYGNTIENELFWLGKRGWEEKSTSVWRQLSERSSIIFDIGANTGLYSLISAKVNPDATVYAFEPLEQIKIRFEKNLELNDLRATCYGLALSDEDGEAKIFAADTISGTFDQASLNAKRFEKVDSNFSTIRTQRLSTFIDQEEVKDIGLMKIDVETFEPRVLKGMGSYLGIFVPTILIEILNDSIADEIEGLVGSLNYEYYLIDEREGYVRRSDLKPGKKGGNFLLLNRARHPDLNLQSGD